MHRITLAKQLSDRVWLFEVEAPLVARSCSPGQFLMVRQNEESERLPLTIADFDRDRGTVSIIFQEVGYSTTQLGKLRTGDSLSDVAGPMGLPFEIEKHGTVLGVAGGVGTAPLYPIVRSLVQAGNRVIVLLGARTKSLLMLEKEMTEAGAEVQIATEDGSAGVKGLVTVLVEEQLEKLAPGPGLMITIGPVPMMRAVSKICVARGIPSIASLNPVMVDGTGMCGGCRVKVGDETKYACVDGPHFDAALIDFDLLWQRQKMYREEEKAAHEHECKLEAKL